MADIYFPDFRQTSYLRLAENPAYGGNMNNQCYDPRPKRRKDKDNPYSLFSTGIDTNDPHYYLSFLDGQGVPICIEISHSVFEVLDRFELEDLSYLNKQDKYWDGTELTDDLLAGRTTAGQELLEDLIARQSVYALLHRAIQKLPQTQRRRVVLHFFNGYTYEQIAKQEHCTKVAIKLSINAAISSLKKYLKNFQNET